MPTDVHAHYVPPCILEALETRAAEFGVSLVKQPPSCRCALQFDYGLKLRPFFETLVEPIERRFAGMAEQGVDRQVLSIWADVFGYGLAEDRRRRWHRFLNEHLAALCGRHDRRFSMLATVPLPNAAAAAAELEHAVKKLGAVGAVVAANVEGVNLGELDLDEFWHAAVELDIAIFIHPTQPAALPRTTRFALSQIAQSPLARGRHISLSERTLRLHARPYGSASPGQFCGERALGLPDPVLLRFDPARSGDPALAGDPGFGRPHRAGKRLFVSSGRSRPARDAAPRRVLRCRFQKNRRRKSARSIPPVGTGLICILDLRSLCPAA